METQELLEKKITRRVGRAVHDFGMIAEDDRIMVGLSGGKDSWTLLHILNRLQRRAPVKFSVTGLSVDTGFGGFQTDRLQTYCEAMGFAYQAESTNMAEIMEKHLTPGSRICSFCARLRRGVLYTVAKREGFTKIALGHHADDLIETLLMAQFFTGEIKSMPPLLHADDGENVVIRPLCYVFEEEIIRYARASDFPVIDCGCPVHKCGEDDFKLEFQRKRTKQLLASLETDHPGIKANLLSSLGRVRERYLMTRPEDPPKALLTGGKE